MCTMGLRARRIQSISNFPTGSEAHCTSCFRMIHNLSANKRCGVFRKTVCSRSEQRLSNGDLIHTVSFYSETETAPSPAVGVADLTSEF